MGLMCFVFMVRVLLSWGRMLIGALGWGSEPRLTGPRQGDANVRTVAVMNEKGGSGKTTTTISLAAVLAERGLRVLVVDLDPQASASLWRSEEHTSELQSSYVIS